MGNRTLEMGGAVDALSARFLVGDVGVTDLDNNHRFLSHCPMPNNNAVTLNGGVRNYQKLDNPRFYGVGAAGWSNPALRNSAHRFEGMGVSRAAMFACTSLDDPAPTTMPVIAGWARGNWIAAT